MGAARAELDPEQDSDGGQQQPGGEQDVQAEAEDAQRHDGDEGNDNDPKHFARSPFAIVGFLASWTVSAGR